MLSNRRKLDLSKVKMTQLKGKNPIWFTPLSRKFERIDERELREGNRNLWVFINLSRSLSEEKRTCFLCGEELKGDLEDINEHIDRCLEEEQKVNRTKKRKKPRVEKDWEESEEEEEESEESEVEIEYEEGVETYTWNGRERIRTCSLLENGYKDLDGQRTQKNIEDEDDDLDIEDDDKVQFGESQYSEVDLVTFKGEVERTLRERVVGHSVPKDRSKTYSDLRSLNNSQADDSETKEEEDKPLQNSSTSPGSLVIESLKSRIREQVSN